MRSVIVTGASGFVGKEICKKLSSDDVEVLAVVRRDSINSDELYGLKNVTVIFEDMSKYDSLHKLINKKIDVFFHFAWAGTSGEKRSDERLQLDNVKYSLDAMRACHRLGCKKFVFAASIMEYQIMYSRRNEYELNDSDTYSISKLTSDMMLSILASKLNISYVCCLISNIYGPGETSQRLINTSIRKLINGEHCSFSTGNQMYDFIFISDAVSAILKVAEFGKSGKTYYIGSLHPRPLKEFLIEMKNCVNQTIELGFGEKPLKGGVLNYDEFDIYSVRDDTGFEPKVDFKEGIMRTILWIKEKEDE